MTIVICKFVYHQPIPIQIYYVMSETVYHQIYIPIVLVSKNNMDVMGTDDVCLCVMICFVGDCEKGECKLMK